MITLITLTFQGLSSDKLDIGINLIENDMVTLFQTEGLKSIKHVSFEMIKTFVNMIALRPKERNFTTVSFKHSKFFLIHKKCKTSLTANSFLTNNRHFHWN